MAAHDYHHYVPRFLLKGWHAPDDHRLTRYAWLRGQLVATRRSAKRVGGAEGLYAIEGATDRNVVEREYLRLVDDRASVVHRMLIGTTALSMTPERRHAWSRFLVSLMMRTPRMIEEIRRRGARAMAGELERQPEEYDSIRGPEEPSTLAQWVAANVPNLSRNLGVMTLPSLVESEPLNKEILKAQWQVRSLARAPIDLLIGDHPLIYIGSMGGAFVLALPLSPSRCFFAFNDLPTRERLGGTSPWRMARTLNHDSIINAQDCVFGTGEQHLSLVRKHLRRPEPLSGQAQTPVGGNAQSDA